MLPLFNCCIVSAAVVGLIVIAVVLVTVVAVAAAVLIVAATSSVAVPVVVFTTVAAAVVVVAVVINIVADFCYFFLGSGPRPSFKIIDGVEAPVNAFPWMVTLQYGGEHFCGGAVISAR